MAKLGGYVVLNTYPSSSSSSVYEVRRGGDGVLYCTCRGWLSNLNSNKRTHTEAPAQCKHTKDHVRLFPGTSYGPVWQAPKLAPAKSSTRRTSEAASPVETKPATADWRSTILKEAKAAADRGIKTPTEALSAFARELDLDDAEQVYKPLVVKGRALDL